MAREANSAAGALPTAEVMANIMAEIQGIHQKLASQQEDLRVLKNVS
jgi:hypothetical protein